MKPTLVIWFRSVLALSQEIGRLHAGQNGLSGDATERGEYFFDDSSIPKPRPCTAVAWASLCAIGPFHGYEGLSGQRLVEQPFDLTHGHFVLPFLPKLAKDDEQGASLPRQSRLHSRDSHGRIRWGSIYIAKSDSGEIIEQLPHGQYAAKEWRDPRPDGFIINNRIGQSDIPPLWGAYKEGWQFGVIQNIAGVSFNLRDPMMELARRGFLETKYHYRTGLACPIRRLMLRFLDIRAARAWAKSYAEAMQTVTLDERKAIEDLRDMEKEIQAKLYAEEKAKELAAFKALTPKKIHAAKLAEKVSIPSLAAFNQARRIPK